MTHRYVGDLHPEVTEATLFAQFSAVGPLASVHVCREADTRRSRGFGYVNFEERADAQRALETMNFTPLCGRPIRIMWHSKDAANHQFNTANIVVRNIDQAVDSKLLHDTFARFGTILSCKVVVDQEGNSRGFGYVNFQTEEEARKAIETANGEIVAGNKIYV
ncbi:hypothetical protein PFISCL1PPCAC_21659, partial [Pristionchus fissidentatus]